MPLLNRKNNEVKVNLTSLQVKVLSFIITSLPKKVGLLQKLLKGIIDLYKPVSDSILKPVSNSSNRLRKNREILNRFRFGLANRLRPMSGLCVNLTLLLNITVSHSHNQTQPPASPARTLCRRLVVARSPLERLARTFGTRFSADVARPRRHWSSLGESRDCRRTRHVGATTSTLAWTGKNADWNSSRRTRSVMSWRLWQAELTFIHNCWYH